MRTICFIGNCQAETLAKFYRRTLAIRTGEVVRYLSYSYTIPDEGLAFIEKADTVVLQKVDWAPDFDISKLSLRGRVVAFPMVSGAFIWPFAGGHDGLVNEAELDHMESEQPEPQSHGMVQVNRLLKTDRPADEIIDEYINLDFASILNLDRFRELFADRQRERDEATGFAVSAFIDENVQKESLFYTLGHYTAPVMRYMVREVFKRLDVPLEDLDRIDRLVRRSDLLAEYTHPIHPSVGRHFGLTYADEKTLYLFRSGERFNFRDYVSQIVKRNFNMKLVRGYIAMRTAVQSPAALSDVAALLEEGLAQSVGSASGEAALSYVLLKQGRNEESLAALERAYALAPGDPDSAIHLANRLGEVERSEEAKSVLARTLALMPDDVPLLRQQAFVLSRERLFEESLVPLRHAFALDPADEHVGRMFIHALNTLGRYVEAEVVARAAITWLPNYVLYHHSLAQALWGQRRYAEAVDAQERAVSLDPTADWLRDRLAHYRKTMPTSAPQQA
jgi:tetratricopeptide (TPR) repeat protein